MLTLPITHPAALDRHQRQDRGHQQRQHDRRAATPGRSAPSSSTQKPGANAGQQGAGAEQAQRYAYTVLVENRCSRKPVVGMTTAMVSMKAVVSHWTVPRGQVQVDHQPRQGHAHDGLVEDDHEGRHQQRGDDLAVTAGQPGVSDVGRRHVGAPVRRSGAARQAGTKSSGRVSSDCPALSNSSSRVRWNAFPGPADRRIPGGSVRSRTPHDRRDMNEQHPFSSADPDPGPPPNPPTPGSTPYGSDAFPEPGPYGAQPYDPTTSRRSTNRRSFSLPRRATVRSARHRGRTRCPRPAPSTTGSCALRATPGGRGWWRSSASSSAT